MTRTKAYRAKWPTSVAVVLAAGAVLFAAPASADQKDDSFIAGDSAQRDCLHRPRRRDRRRAQHVRRAR